MNTDGNAISNKTFGEQFTFDTTGNWLNYKRDANGDGTFEVDQTRTHNLANEILTISSGNTLVSHDRNGCMTKVPKPNSWSSAYTLVYDAWNRLISVSDGDTLVATYVYDARNHRIKKTVGNTVTLSYFNRNWQEVESVTAGVTTTYVYGLRYIDDVISRATNNNGDVQTLYALQDPNWNVVALMNTSSTVTERMTYDSFGRVTFRNASFVAKTASSYNWTKTFTGQVYDTETGLMLYRNRYYHTGLGRFITRDPIGYDARDLNLYRGVFNRPVNYVDKFGTFGWGIGAMLGAVVGVGISLVTSWWQEESTCQTTCKAVGSGLVGAIAGAFAGTTGGSFGTSCAISAASAMVSGFVGPVCDSLCDQKNSFESLECVIAESLMKAALGCAGSWHESAGETLIQFVMSVISELWGYDIGEACNIIVPNQCS